MQFAREPTTQVAANLASELCYTNRQALSAGLIVAGFDSRAGGSVYSIPLGGSLHKQDMAVSGSGSTVGAGASVADAWSSISWAFWTSRIGRT